MTTDKNIKHFFILLLFLFLGQARTEAQLQAAFTAAPTTGCAPIRVVFQDQSTGQPTAWNWDLGNGTTSTLKDPSGIYFNPGNYTVKLTVYRAADSSTITKIGFVTVYAFPAVNFSATPQAGCYPLNVSFLDQTGSASGAITNWQWDFGDGNVSTQQNPTNTYYAAGLFNISLTVKNNFGCSKTLTKPNLITVGEKVTANFSNTFPSACQLPSAVQFTNLSTGNVSSYFWTFGDGQTSPLANPNHVYTTAGNYNVTLTVRNSLGCTDVITRNNLIYVGIVDAMFDRPDSICINNTFNIINQCSPYASLSGCTWDFGDGTTDTAFNPAKFYIQTGTYTIKLVADFGGCKDTIVKSIYVSPKPVAGFTATNTTACAAPLTTSFTNTSAGATPLVWYFGDGTNSTAVNPVHTYTVPGTYAVTLVVRNGGGCLDTIVKNSMVVIGPPKIVQVSPLPQIGCVPLIVNFATTVQSVDPISSYVWDFGDGSSSTAATPSHTYTIEGTYTVRLKISTPTGCYDTFYRASAVKVGNKPQVFFKATPRIACAMDEITFTDNSSGNPDKWLWDFGDGGFSVDQHPRHYYGDTGYFHVKLVVWRNGCSDTLYQRNYIYIRPPISGLLDSFSCSNQKEHFFLDRSKGAVFYKYWFGDGDSSTLANPIHLYADTGRYTIKQEVRDSLCKHESTISIIVLDEKAAFSLRDSIACSATSVTYIAAANPANILSFAWSFGDGSPDAITSVPTITHLYPASGMYPGSLVITDLNNCRDTVRKPVSFHKYGPKAGVVPFQAACVHTPLSFGDFSLGDGISSIIEWAWDFGEGQGWEVFTSPRFNHTYTAGGLYTVKLRVTDALGCIDEITMPDNVQINDPYADFTASDTLRCRNTPVQFNGFVSGDNLTLYRWDFGDGDSSFILNPSHAYTTEGIYDITLTLYDNLGCADTVIKRQFVNVFDAKAMFALSDTFTTCPPLLGTFTNQSLHQVSSSWNFGDGNTSTLLNPLHTYSISGTYYAQLNVTGSGGCTDSMIKKIVVLGPRGSFTYTPIKGCSPLQVRFTSNAQNSDLYTWDFNDGATSFGTDSGAVHTYTRLGDFLPKIILEDSAGCKVPVFGIDSIRIRGITAHIKTIIQPTICDSGFVSFTDSTETNDTIQSYQWNFGDGTLSNLQNPVHQYTTQGLHTVTLTVTTVTGCTSSTTLSSPIKIVVSPSLRIDGNAAGCIPATALLNGTWLNRDTAQMSWQWDFGNGQASNLQNPPSVTYPLAGNYTIRLVGTNSSGCADTITKLMQAYALPVVDGRPDRYICRGQSQLLTATGARTYTWNTDATLSCLACANPVARPDSTRWYRVEGTDSNGCKSADTVYLQVKQRFKIKVDKGDTICAGQTVRLGVLGAENYVWTPATYLNNNTSSNPVARPDTTVKYMVTGYDSLGCFRDTAYVTIKVHPIPKVNIVQDHLEMLVGNSVQLNSITSPDVTRWYWTPANDLSCSSCANPIASPGLDQIYTLTVTNAGNCTAQDKVNIFMLCSGTNVFIPNTFSPNGDGVNDLFYPRGKGLFTIRAIRIFNRWGALVFEKTNFDANDPRAGWDGTNKGQPVSPDVYVYTVDVLCDNSTIGHLKGNVTLLK